MCRHNLIVVRRHKITSKGEQLPDADRKSFQKLSVLALDLQ